MTHTILAIRAPGEHDAALYPTLADASTIAIEPLDGEPLRLPACGLALMERVAGDWRTHVRLKGVRADALITDARFAVSCASVDTRIRRRPIGAQSAIVKLADDLRSGRVDGRSAVLVGQIRYRWLRCVGFRPKTGWSSNEEVRLGVVVEAADGSARQLYLDVRLPSNVDSAAVARAVVRRAARYRLVHGPIGADAERRIYEHLADAPRLAPPARTLFALYDLTQFSFVSAASAYPGSDAPLRTKRST